MLKREPLGGELVAAEHRPGALALPRSPRRAGPVRPDPLLRLLKRHLEEGWGLASECGRKLPSVLGSFEYAPLASLGGGSNRLAPEVVQRGL